MRNIFRFSVIFCVSLCLLALLALAGCNSGGTGASSFSLAPGADGWVDGSKAASSPAGAAGQSESEAQPLQATGVIDSAGMGEFFVELEDGQVVAFAYGDADISKLADTRPGSPVRVWYTGDLADEESLTVISMETP